MADAQVTAKMGLDASPAQKSLQATEGKFKSFSKRVGANIASTMRTSLTGMAAGIGAAVGATVRKSLSDGMEQMLSMEDAQIGMKSMLGSLEKAQEAMAMIGKEASENPMFSKQELAATASALVGFADKSTSKLHGLVEQAQLLSTLKPSAGLVGAAEALRDAIGGETERLKEYGFTGKELSSMKAKGGDMTVALMEALEKKGITSATLRDMAGSQRAQMSALNNELANVGQSFWEAIWPELGAQLESITGWMKTNKDEIVAGLQVIADGVALLVKAAYKAGAVVDKASDSAAKLAYGERDLSKVEMAYGAVNPMFGAITTGLSLMGRYNKRQRRGTGFGDRTKQAIKAGQVKQAAPQVLTVRVQGDGVKGTTAAT